jgi:glycosyltransferase involved in cell wall biosynthesis
LKIDILATHGSPLGVTSQSIYGQDGRMGVGGAELALLTMCEGWAHAGHEITLYNNPTQVDTLKFNQQRLAMFHPREERDFLIIFRAPTTLAMGAKGKKVWWSTDQYTINDYRDYSKRVDKIVCISPYHQEYFKQRYGIDTTVAIDLPVRQWDYDQEIERIPFRCLFSSVPDRGLNNMFLLWNDIKARIPEATLMITSDYRLWGNPSPGNEIHRMKFLKLKDVTFAGALYRKDFVKEQLRADVLTYPCTYEELFCYAVAEAEMAGAMPFTTMLGALPTTNMGYLFNFSDFNFKRHRDLYVENLAKFLYDKDKEKQRTELQEKAFSRFALPFIMEQWDKLVFEEDK